MKTLITGATGLLGSRYYYIFGKHDDVIGTYFLRPEVGYVHLSLLDKNSILSLFDETKPDVVIHTAGIANPDKCDVDRKGAYDINLEGTKHIVDACKRSGSFLVFISTSHVFSEGKPSEEEEPNPVNYYGQTKLEAEKYIIKELKNYIILRPTKLYGFIETGEDFTKTVIRKVKENGKLKVDNNVKYYPVITDDLVELTKKLIDLGIRGIYNVSSSKPYTKFEWSNLIVDSFNLDKNKIKGVKEDTLSKRPMNLSPSTEKLEQLNFKLTNLEDGVNKLKKQMGCTFNLIYSYRPYKMIQGKNATLLRVDLGKSLAKNEFLESKDLDMVVPVPESGIYPAQGYADGVGIPLYHAIIMDYETKKTLYEPQVNKRVEEIRKKLIVIPELVKGKKIVLVDEAIISGLTLTDVIEKLKDAGTMEIHVRIPSPIMFKNCKYNVLAKDAKLISKKFQGFDKEAIEEKLAKHFKVNSLRFLSLETFRSILSNRHYNCLDCFRRQKNG